MLPPGRVGRLGGAATSPRAVSTQGGTAISEVIHDVSIAAQRKKNTIEDFHERGDLALGIPAHRSGTGVGESYAVRWAGEQAFRADVRMNDRWQVAHGVNLASFRVVGKG